MAKPPSEFAKITAETLNEPIIRQIISFLRSSAKHGTDCGLTFMEWHVLDDAAHSLDKILSWKDPTDGEKR